MNRDLMLRAGKYKKRRKLRHLWKRIVSVLGCVVVFCTTYALILPAVTQERESFCGIEAHIHDQECLVQGSEIDHYELMCSYETLGVHQHDDSCYDEQKNLICTEIDYLIHVHDETCYREDGKFACMIPEVPPHEHTQECYQLLGGHVHGEECYAFTRGALICTLPEEEAHTHQEDCWIFGEQLLCGVESEHVHSSECYAAVSEYVCGYGQEHLHTEACYGPGTQLLCTAEEQHVHTDECYISSQELICGFEQEHTHNEGCYSVSQICAVPENHFHQSSCFAPADLICTDASEEHQHADSCYGEPVLLCTTPEGHVHSEQCFEQILSCQITEHIHADCYAAPELICSKAENHTHTDSCYEQVLLCQKAEHVHTDACLAAPELLCTLSHVHTDDCREKILQCTLAETAGHRHTDACYEQQIELVCTLEETPGTETLVCEQPDVPVHIHSDSCYIPIYKYEVVCTLPEHTHQLSCYSDPTADVETERDWEKSFKHVTLTGVWEADVLAIAESQLGYHESTRNYIVLEDGVSTRGYTRYGAWYRAPYGDWCAMFASFCLHYAQVEGMPLEAHCQNWIKALSEPDVNLYHPVGTYTPKPGDLVFFEYDDDNNSDHVGLVVEYKEQLKTIEGNSAEAVRKVTYELDDPTIIGYGAIPELLNQAADDEAVSAVYYCGAEEHLHGEECSDAEGNFICTLTEHQHGEECLVKPEETPAPVVYYCGMEEHLHGEECSDAEGNFICIAVEHQHGEECLVKPEETPAPVVYYCGVEEHLHGEECSDAEGNFICVAVEHQHGEECLVKPEETPAPVVYYCGVEEHLHGEACLDSEGNLICTLTEHTHDDTCLIEPAPVIYHCGMEEHLHGETCLDSEGNLICTLTEHTHDDTCRIEPAPVTYHCGMEEHLHGEACLDSEGNFICTLTEHTHNEGCLLNPENAYFCGSVEHAHTEACYGESGELVCTLEEHTHTLVCSIDLSPFTQDVGRQICEVTVMIDKLLTLDQIEEKIQEYESVGDYEGEGAWMTELYQQVQNTYRRYALLPAEAQEAVPNRDKLLEMEFIWSIMPLAETLVGYAIPYGPEYFTSTGKFVFYTQGASGQYYAFDQDGNAVPVSVDANGMITISSDNEETLLWTLTGNGSDHFIQSVSNSRYMHAYPHSGSSVTTSGTNASVLEPVGTGLRVRSNTEYAYLDEASGIFRVTSDVNNAAVYSLGVIYDNQVWLDGTNGGLMSLYGSPDKAYPSSSPTFILPTYWESPTKYAYTLRGWYDVINGEYYAPGAPVTVTSDMVFYADWVAETYNIGQYNAHTADTISTNEFITVRVFDYSSMFNTLSTTAEVTFSADGHSEVWSMADDKEGSPGFIFRDWDRGSRDISYPAGLTAVNNNGDVYQGLLTAQRRDLLFNPDTSFNPYTGEGVLGKQYLGKADHLFQYGESPSDGENYGYYYYDSHYNAASFHKDHGRFYVYDYLERTSDSQTTHSDFLPFNSPYVNTNGKTVSTYSYEGINGEYAGTTHYMYDAKDTGNGSDPSHVATNYWFGISMTMDFYLPNTPGTVDAEGNPANQSVHGDNMVFEFSGDDDVWVLIDGQMVLDLGGIHGDEFGSINFTTGEVIVNGASDGSVTYLEPGSHTLTMYYLERGSSMSNCKIRFNLSPRYSLTLQKEDVLTRDLLNGAKFAVYTDAACTVPAQLWPNQASHDRGEDARNEFTVANGKAVMWGLSAGTTYYMKEIQPPENREETVHGIVVMTLNNQGQASYSVIADHGELSGGFTVHGYRIDQETQEAYLVITNAENVTETTDLFVRKKWNDSANHSGDSVTVYLMVDGTVIREAELSAANDWTYVWSNMPKYLADGVTPVPYVVREGTVPGYIGQVESITETGQMITTWEETDRFVNRETYLLSSFQGYLAAADDEIYFISNQADAADEPAAQWDVTVYSGGVVLRNKLGLTLCYKGWPTFRFVARASTSGSTTQLHFSNGIFRSGNSYMCNDAGDGTINASSSSNAVRYTLHQRTETPEVLPEGTTGYLIVNTPVEENDTLFLTVKKEWELGLMGSTSMYEQLTVNVRLLANGSDSGMRGQLSLRNGWTTTFSNLPKKDNAGNTITYTVEEMDVPGIWSPHYGEIVPVEGVANTYTTTITNVNTLNYMLPETGGSGTIWYTLCGAALILTALALLGYKISSERRKEEYHSS